MLTVVRHGQTKLNGDHGVEKLRGWLDVPLSDEGNVSAMKAGEELKRFNLPADTFNSSPLKRAVQTSEHIKDAIDLPFQTADGLKDWNTGELSGQPVKDTLAIIHHHIDNPDEKIPGGESFNQFLSRVVPYLKDKVESSSNHLVVTHNRLATLLKAISSKQGKAISKAVLKNKGPIEPGGIMQIHPDWNIDVLSRPSNNDV